MRPLLILLSAGFCSLVTAATPPNFLFIVAAFLGYGPYHKAKDQFYKDLQALPADSPR